MGSDGQLRREDSGGTEGSVRTAVARREALPGPVSSRVVDLLGAAKGHGTKDRRLVLIQATLEVGHELHCYCVAGQRPG